MPRRCAVPGCFSNYDSSLKIEPMVSTFTFPKDATRRKAWLRSIHRENWKPSTSSGVCLKHFDDKYVVKTQIYKNPNGEIMQLLLRHPKLSKDAIPTIFDDLSAYQCTTRHRRKKPLEVEREKIRSPNETECFLKSNVRKNEADSKKKEMESTIVVIDDDFTIDVEEDQGEEVLEDAVHMRTTSEWNTENDQFIYNPFIRIKEEIIDFEDNYLDVDGYVDLMQIKTEIDSEDDNKFNNEISENIVEVQNSPKQVGEVLTIEETQTETEIVPKLTEENPSKGLGEILTNQKTLTETITAQLTKDNPLEEMGKIPITEETQTESVIELRKENENVEIPKMFKEDKSVLKNSQVQVASQKKIIGLVKPQLKNETKPQEEPTKELKTSTSNSKRRVRGRRREKFYRNYKPPPYKLNLRENTSQQWKEVAKHKRRDFTPNKWSEEPLGKWNQFKSLRSSFRRENKPRSRKPPFESNNQISPIHHQLSNANKSYKCRPWEERRFANQQSIFELPPTSWQTYSTILNVLTGVLNQQKPQNDPINYVGNRKQKRWRKWDKRRWNERPEVWARDTSVNYSSQMQTYNTILQAVTQLNNGAVSQNFQNSTTVVNNVTCQISSVNMFRPM